MTTYLLDANVLIALVIDSHPQHERVTGWAEGLERFAVCPVVEGALVRLVIRMGSTPEDAKETLRVIGSRPGHEFWPDSLSYADAALGHVRGHRQVTDAYLAALADGRDGARLATLDEGAAQEMPATTYLIPADS